MSTTSKERTGSDAAGGEAPQGKKFPWWLLLLALALIALVAFLLTRGGDDAGDGAATSQEESAETADGTADGDAADADAQEGADADVQPGKVTVGGATVYPLSEGLTVGDYDGQDAIGRNVPVESVVADEGFWIGTSADDRIFVLLTNTGPESTPEVEAGDTIDFEGVVVKHGDDFAQSVGVDGDEGAQRLNALAGHLEIPEYSPSGE